MAGPGTAVGLACAACCIGPILSVLAAIGITSAVGALWMPMLAVLAVAAGLGATGVHRRTRRGAGAGCGAGHDRVVDLPMPLPARRELT